MYIRRNIIAKEHSEREGTVQIKRQRKCEMILIGIDCFESQGRELNMRTLT